MLPPLAYWVDNLSPFVIHFWGNVGIRWYGLAYVFGFLAGGWLMVRYSRAGRSSLPAGQVPDFILALVMGVLLGGRIGYFLFYDFDLFVHHPLVLFRVWEGGMASHGGFIGVFIAVWWFARRSGIPFLHLADVQASAVSAGLLFGRLANFINGELWGKISTVPWAVIFPKSDPDKPFATIPPRHPSQLYEAALEGALLLAFMQWRVWKTNVLRTQPGRLCGEFMLSYAAVRIFCEVFREPDVGVSLIFDFSRGTFYSLFLAAVGGALIIYSMLHRTPEDPAGKSR
jgi:phosphatidylglycerol:prolipoprotein diacylglycerol transferase